MKIGFFDSGLGGLTIMNSVVKLLPQYDYEFYGDTANLPYGDKNEDQIFELTRQGIVELFNRDCLLVIIACNTASAETLRKLQNEFLITNYPQHKVLGVIIPTIEVLLEEKIKTAILIGTNRTVDSKKYDAELSKYSNSIKLNSIATPDLVPLIENQEYDKAFGIVSAIIEQRTREEAIILGCTHYTILHKELQAQYGDSGNFKIFSQDSIIPEKLKKYLENHPEIEKKLTKNYQRNIYLTKHTKKYDNLLQELLGGIFI